MKYPNDNFGISHEKRSRTPLLLRDAVTRKRKYLINSGGLGNQLFIYAAAHLILKNSPKSKIVIVQSKLGKKSHSPREFWLPKFKGTCGHPIDYKESLLLPFVLKKLDQLLSVSPILGTKLSQLVGYEIARDPHDISLLQRPETWLVARGFFQHVQLVISVEPEIKEELWELGNVVMSSCRQIDFKLEKLESSVVFHFRRGDFLENKNSIGVLDLKFYTRFFHENLGTKFITSDDPKIQLALPDFHETYFLNPNKYSALETFFIMCRASKVYAANSTFSWWAALVCIWHDGEGHIPSPFYKMVDAPKLRHPKMILEEAIYEEH
jgi:hypothetical protein